MKFNQGPKRSNNGFSGAGFGRPATSDNVSYVRFQAQFLPRLTHLGLPAPRPPLQRPASLVRRSQSRRHKRLIWPLAAAATATNNRLQNSRPCRSSALLELQSAAAAASDRSRENDVHETRGVACLPQPTTPLRAPRLERRRSAAARPSLPPLQSSKPAPRFSRQGAPRTRSQHAFPLPPRHDDSTFKGEASSAPSGGERGSRRSSSLWR